MNCEQVKQNVSIRVVLESYGLFPIKENKRTAFYFALDREEKTASLSVDFIKNTAFDFGTGKSYDVISIVQTKNKCDVSTALEYLSKFDFSNSTKDSIEASEDLEYKILKIVDICHPALQDYLKSRKVLEYRNLVKEIHYRIKGKYYFGIGFHNNSGGIEIRNKYSKICLGPKDISFIKSNHEKNSELAVFEGFFDYLSYKTIEKEISSSDTDYLVLNSTSMLFRAEEIIKEYEKISLFLDNDTSGKITTEKIIQINRNVEDCSSFYQNYKDLNSWLTK